MAHFKGLTRHKQESLLHIIQSSDGEQHRHWTMSNYQEGRKGI